MNAEEIQYALDRRNYVNISGGTSEIDKPIQLGHLTGDVIIESTDLSELGYLGPAGRHVFEYNYTGVQTPPRIFFKGVRCENPESGTYSKLNVGFFKVVQPNTSPKALFFEHCLMANRGCYLIDGPDVSSIDGIQIKHCSAGGSGFVRWRLRADATMGFFEIYNSIYRTGRKVGASQRLKNTRGIWFHVYDDEQEANLHEDLLGNYEGPIALHLINPKGYNFFEHNWHEYSTDYDTEATGCWGASIRVDDVSGNYGMHFVRSYQDPFAGGAATGVAEVQYFGGHSDTNAGSLYCERLDNHNFNDVPLFAGKVFPKMIDGQDVEDATATAYTDLNATGMTSRMEVFDADGQPVLYGNTRTGYYNTQFRLDRESKGLDYEDILFAQTQKAYGGKNSTLTVDGTDVVVKFTGNDTLVVTEEIEVEYLIVGGGGSGGAKNAASLDGGGGGAGGYTSNFGGTTVTLSAGSYPIVVGEGGKFTWGTYGVGVDGGSSSFNGITVTGGGGGGGSENGTTYLDGNPGASGGGASGQGGSVGGTSTAYGNDGGSSAEVSGSSGTSGGGGAGGVGGDGYLDSVVFGGNGGVGVANAITGTSVTYCEGGGGGVSNNNSGDGGVEGGGWPRASNQGGNERDGKPNLGSGGAGGGAASGSFINYPGNGSNGVVIIRYSSL